MILNIQYTIYNIFKIKYGMSNPIENCMQFVLKNQKNLNCMCHV